MRELKKRPVWVCWRFADRDGRKTKTPINPRNGRFARTNDPTTWATFDEAERAVKTWNCDGVGFCFSGDIFGIDIDGDGHTTQNPLQNEVLPIFKTYTEKSPSGAGLHILFRCDRSRLPLDENGKLSGAYYLKNPHSNLEFYGAGITHRFFTYTGNSIGETDIIEDKTAEAVEFLERFMRRPECSSQINTAMERDTIPRGFAAPVVSYPTADTDAADAIAEAIKIARKSRNGEKFKSLYDFGDTTAYGGDDSAADLALTELLSFYLQGDPEKVDKAFRNSALCREKWLSRPDYRESTIRKAISLCAGQYYKRPGRPRISEAKNGDENDVFTIEGLEEYLSERGCDVRLNVMTQRIEVDGMNDENQETLNTNLPAILFSELQSRFRRINIQTITEYLSVIASRCCFNPVIDIISKTKHDGVDRLPGLFEILGVSDSLSEILIHKWLLQSISLLHNGEDGEIYGGDGCLVLQGAQGIGKTSVFRKLAIKEQFFGEGIAIDARDKDSIIRATSVWLCELGEIESCFKSDVERLKAILTAASDEVRRPYARAAAKTLRRTSFCGSCNSEQFLVDQTGNRRFWVVPVERIDLERLAKFDVLQLWAQIAAEVEKNPQGFRLSADEQKALSERNSAHEKKIAAQDEVEDILSETDKPHCSISYEYMTVSEFRRLYLEELGRFTAAQLGRALDRCGVEATAKRVDGKVQRMRLLPRRKYY